jgi:hypothetical protein
LIAAEAGDQAAADMLGHANTQACRHYIEHEAQATTRCTSN